MIQNAECFILILGLFSTIFSLGHLSAQELHDGNISSSYEEVRTSEKVTENYIGFYQKYISKARGSECPMYPSCSNYGLKCFRDRSFFDAMLLTSERMLRCGHDKKFYDTTLQYGEKSLLDWPTYQEVPHGLTYKGNVILRAGVPSKTKDQISFINYLINHQQYDVALLEIERAFYFQTPAATQELYRNKLLCYEALGKEEEGIFEYEVHFPDSVKQLFPVSLKAAKLYYSIENFDKALTSLEAGIVQTPYEDYQKTVFHSIILTSKKEYDLAISVLGEAQNRLSDYDSLIGKSKQIIDNIQKTPLKKPAIAKALSIIPGGGYVYTKHYQTAITSFLINAVLAYATYNCIKKENYGMACLTGIFSFTFYVGNIIGGGKSAHRYNKSIINRQIDKISEINGLSYY